MKKKIIICTVTAIMIVLSVFIVKCYKTQKLINELKNVEDDFIGVFQLEGYKENFADLDLKYIGQAKVGLEKTKKYEMETYSMTIYPRFDGDTLYAIDGYLFFESERSFEIYKDTFKLYDIGFELEYEEGKMYVMSLGRELKWLQFNPDWISQSGTVANRAGFKWDEETVPNTVYVYEFSYDNNKYGNLGVMAAEF